MKYNRTAWFCSFLLGLVILMHFAVQPVDAAFVENLAISTEAMALGNSVTARPPGHASVHYNPAGLAKLPEGAFVSQGVHILHVSRRVRFESDQDFKGFMGNTFGPHATRLDRLDPLDGQTGHLTGMRLRLPFLGNLDIPLPVAPAPTNGFHVKKPGSPWTFCVLPLYPVAAGGFLFEDSNDPVHYMMKDFHLQHLNFGFGVGYELTPTVSLGVSFGTGITSMNLSMDARSPSDLTAITKMLGETTEGFEIPVYSEMTMPPPWFGGGLHPFESPLEVSVTYRDDFTPNYNLGFLWEPAEWFSFGMVYQSEIAANMYGRYTFNYSEDWQRMISWQGSSPLLVIVSGMFDLPTNGIPTQSGASKINIVIPEAINLGVKIKPFKKLSVMCDYHWQKWSKLKQFVLNFDQDIQLLRLAKLMGYTGGSNRMVMDKYLMDSNHFSFGLEYQVNKRLALRTGFEDRTASSPMRYYSLQGVPDFRAYGIGAEIKVPKEGIKLDVAFEYYHKHEIKIPNNTSWGMNYSKDFTKPVYNPYAGLNVYDKMAIYKLSATATFPFTVFIEHQKHLMHKQEEVIHKIVTQVKKLNPMRFFRKGKPEEAEEEAH